jgi:hypothetical protein
MTRKDFETIADLLNSVRIGLTRYADFNMLCQFDVNFIPRVADELAAANHRFDHKRFIAACGVEAR